VTDLVERLNAGIDVANRRLLTLRTQQDIEVALVFREILVETRDEIERLGRELTEARDGFKEAMSDHADTLDRLAEAERDAARYRWLREADIVDWDAIPFPVGYDHPDDTLDDLAKMLDASIDACMTSSTVSGIEK
jgi:alkanesulfonate monooxygenase SsuD/methylene tetrahydromethanopterin reductase-like flavin-dependent oxidoreductase (luciferase family)